MNNTYRPVNVVAKFASTKHVGTGNSCKNYAVLKDDLVTSQCFYFRGPLKFGKEIEMAKQKHCMKDHVHFFIVFTLLELVFTALYYSVVKTVDKTILIGGGLYTASMVAGYFSYRAAVNKMHKKELLDALP